MFPYSYFFVDNVKLIELNDVPWTRCAHGTSAPQPFLTYVQEFYGTPEL